MGATVEPGDILGGKYRIEHLLGEGGMGLVYAATHLALEQRVAVKVLRAEAAEKPESVERFAREARAAAKIQSVHVARVLDIAFLENGVPYMVMEYLEGEDLAQVVVRDGPLDPAEAVRHVLAACEALAEVHAQGMVHRDLKPANLFLALRPDGSRHVKLLDFGISKTVVQEGAAASSTSLTRTSAVLGSPRYMAPEQLRSSRDVDARADIWALGVTLFELLTNVAPFGTGTLAEVCAAILKEPPADLATLRHGLPDALVRAVGRCLQKEPEARYGDLRDLARDLAPLCGPEGGLSLERVSGVLDRSSGPSSVVVPPISAAVRAAATVDSGERREQPVDAEGVTMRPPSPVARTGERTGEILNRLGDRSRVLRVAVEKHTLSGLALDPRSAFLLSRVDGATTVDEILDVCGMPADEALEVLDHLLDERLIVIDASPNAR